MASPVDLNQLSKSLRLQSLCMALYNRYTISDLKPSM